MDRALIEYAVNAAWQLPVLAAGAWLLLRMAKPSAATQHQIWMAVLALAIALPFAGVLVDSSGGVAGAHVEVASQSAFTSGVSTAGVEQPNIAIPAVKLSDADATEHWMASAAAALASLRLTRRITVSARIAEWVTGIYLLAMLLGFLRIARAWRGTQRLVRDSCDPALTHDEQMLVKECARKMNLQEPAIRVIADAGRLGGPVVVGAMRPVLLCPEGFLRGLLESGREDEATAALCHEMAHVLRRDYALNLVCEIMAAPLRWHPVTYGVERRIRSTREMACDAAAAQAMASETEYARCLVGLAERMTMGGMVEQPGATGLFSGNALEERVMRLMETKTAMSARAKVARRVAGATAMTAAMLLAGMVHVVPARAQSNNVTTTVAEVMPIPAAVSDPVAIPAPKAQAEPAEKPEPSAAPQALPVPAAQAKPAPGKAENDHTEIITDKNGTFYVWADGHSRKLTPAERARVEKQLEQAEKKLAASEARINSAEFRASIAKAERAAQQVDMAKIQKQLDKEQAMLNSPEFKIRIAEAQKHAEKAIAELQTPEFQAQMKAAEQALKNAQIQQQLAQVKIRVNSRQIEEQVERAQREAMQTELKINSGEMQKQMAAARQELQKELDSMKAQDSKSDQPAPHLP